jgi:hypothetical protein
VSIWRRRPRQASAILPYVAMSLLYKRSNRFWRLLIKHRLVHTIWSPLVSWTRLRHLAFRRRLERRPLPSPEPALHAAAGGGGPGHVISAGV